MLAYIIRRLLLIIPTLFGIMVINFVIVQFAPGGPVEQMIAQIQGTATDATSRISGGGGDFNRATDNSQLGGSAAASKYRGAQGLDPKFIAEIEKQFGFDKPPIERFWLMIRDYLNFDFGRSYFKSARV